MTEKPIIDADEAAELLGGVPKSLIYRYSSLGMFPVGVKLYVGPYIRFDREKLLEWVRSGAAGSKKSAGRRKKTEN